MHYAEKQQHDWDLNLEHWPSVCMSECSFNAYPKDDLMHLNVFKMLWVYVLKAQY